MVALNKIHLFFHVPPGPRTDKYLNIQCCALFFLGNKPDFHNAKSPDDARGFYAQFLANLRSGYQEDKIKDGQFGAMMSVNIVNDGPVTLELESDPNFVAKGNVQRSSSAKKERKQAPKEKGENPPGLEKSDP